MSIPLDVYKRQAPDYPVTFLIMLIASVISSTLATRVKKQARQSAQKAYYTELLMSSSQKLQQGKNEQEIIQLAAEQVSILLERPVLYALAKGKGELQFQVTPAAVSYTHLVGTFNPEVFPEELMNKIATAIATTPFPLMLEALVIHFIYEIMREAGLRLPKPLGHAVSIVGALVIGDTAISSGLIGATTLMVVALTAISSYVIPSLYEPIAILRLLSLIHI